MTNIARSVSMRERPADWQRDDAAIVVFAEAQRAPSRLLASYAVTYAEVFRTHHPLLNALNMADVVAEENGVAFVHRNGLVEAGLHYSRVEIDGGVRIDVKGLVSSGKLASVASPLVSAAAITEIGRAEVVSARAVVRVLPDGLVNAASAKVLSRAGFFPKRVKSNEIAPSNLHLYHSVASDIERFLSLEMVATAIDLLAASRKNLEGWS